MKAIAVSLIFIVVAAGGCDSASSPSSTDASQSSAPAARYRDLRDLARALQDVCPDAKVAQPGDPSITCVVDGKIIFAALYPSHARLLNGLEHVTSDPELIVVGDNFLVLTPTEALGEATATATGGRLGYRP